MRAIVCGAGEVGTSIAHHLVDEGNAVTLVDESPERLRRARNVVDTETLEGLASKPDVLDRADASSADMLIAVTRDDEVNMVACEAAWSLFDVQTKIARVSDPEYLRPEWDRLFGRDALHIDERISPEREVAESLARRVAIPGTRDSVTFADNRVQLVGLNLDGECPVLDTPLAQLTELFPDLRANVVYIVRDDEGFVPDKSARMEAGDEVYVVAEAGRTARVLDAFGRKAESARSIVVVGGGRIGTGIVRRIEESEPEARIRVIELDPANAERASERLERAVVLAGDPLDREILDEAGVGGSDMLLAVTDNDEVNTLVSVLAKRHGCAYAAAVIHRTTYGSLMTRLGIDAVISPREVTVSKILRHVRRGRVKAVHTVHDGRAEAMEVEALESSQLVGRPLREQDMPEGLAIGALVRDGAVTIPGGDTVVRPGDRAIVFARHEAVPAAEKIFSVEFGFF